MLSSGIFSVPDTFYGIATAMACIFPYSLKQQQKPKQKNKPQLNLII